MPNDLKFELDFIHKKWPNKSNVSGRTPVVVKTNVPGGNTVFGVQFWTDEMIKTGTSTNTDKTVSKLAATPKWYNNETSPVTESVTKIVRRVIKEEMKRVRLNESSTLIVKPSTQADLIKLKKWFDNSDYYAEYNNEWKTFSLEDDDLDALEMSLDKELNRAGISVSYESE